MDKTQSAIEKQSGCSINIVLYTYTKATDCACWIFLIIALVFICVNLYNSAI